MGWWQKLWRQDSGFGIDELSRRLEVGVTVLREFAPRYNAFEIPKRNGGRRRILAPEPVLKTLQRQILHVLLARLKTHAAVTGFRRGESILTNARRHERKAVVLRFDLQDFFTSTRADRVERYFRKIGWNQEASAALTRLCTWQGSLPQGAPTSPALSNLVNRRLDTRLSQAARHYRAVYTRYADDLTFSFETDTPAVHAMKCMVGQIVRDEGYRLNRRKKVSIRRRHQQQLVTGLVVNVRANLPRQRRRWLRAVAHRYAQAQQAELPSEMTHEPPTLTASQLAGWHALHRMLLNDHPPP